MKRSVNALSTAPGCNVDQASATTTERHCFIRSCTGFDLSLGHAQAPWKGTLAGSSADGEPDADAQGLGRPTVDERLVCMPEHESVHRLISGTPVMACMQVTKHRRAWSMPVHKWMLRHDVSWLCRHHLGCRGHGITLRSADSRSTSQRIRAWRH